MPLYLARFREKFRLSPDFFSSLYFGGQPEKDNFAIHETFGYKQMSVRFFYP